MPKRHMICGARVRRLATERSVPIANVNKALGFVDKFVRGVPLPRDWAAACELLRATKEDTLCLHESLSDCFDANLPM